MYKKSDQCEANAIETIGLAFSGNVFLLRCCYTYVCKALSNGLMETQCSF